MSENFKGPEYFTNKTDDYHKEDDHNKSEVQNDSENSEPSSNPESKIESQGDQGIPLGKETLELDKSKIQELVDSGKTKAEAIEAVKNELKKGYAYKDEKMGFVVKDLKPKIEGETFVIDGQAVQVESINGNGKYMVRNLATGKFEQVDKSDIDNESNERNERLQENFKERFGFSDEDIKTLRQNPEYQKLSFGQKRFIFESLTGSTAEKADEISDLKFNQKTAGKNIFSRMVSNLTKETQKRDLKRETFDEIRSGGLEKHKDSIDAIMTRLAIMNTPIIENVEGEIEVQYSESFAKLLPDTDQARRTERAFNQAATALHNIPPEWESINATSDQKEAVAEARRIYDIEKEKCRNLLVNQENADGELIKEKLEKINGSVELNRLMDAHPDNEKTLNEIYKKVKTGLAGDAVKEAVTKDNKLHYMVFGGLIRRGLEIASMGGAGIFTGAIGAIRGVSTAKKTIRENEINMRRGGENKLKLREDENLFKRIVNSHMDVNMTEINNENNKGHKGFIEKINDISQKIKDANELGKADEVAFYTTMLKNRTAYAIERARNGKISFGNKDHRLSNQMAFLEAINQGEILTSAVNPENLADYNSRMGSLMDKLYGKQESTEKTNRRKYIAKYATRNAIIGATLGSIGYKLHDVFFGAPDFSHNAPHMGNTENIGSYTAEIDNTYVATENPNLGGLHGGKNIDDFFNHKSDTNIVDTQPKTPHQTEIPKVIENENVSIPEDAYIKKGEGIEHALRRQIEHNPEIAKKLGWDGKTPIHKFSGSAAHKLAIDEGYVDPKNGSETRISFGGEKSSFYEIKTQADGSLKIAEGHDNIYIDSDANEYIYKNGVKTGVINHQNLKAPSAEGAVNSAPENTTENTDYNEYSLDELDPNNQGYEKYINENGEEIYRLKNLNNSPASGSLEKELSNSATNKASKAVNEAGKATANAKAEVKVQVGKPLSSSSNPTASTRNYLTPIERNDGTGNLPGRPYPGSQHLTPQNQGQFYRYGQYGGYDQNGYRISPRGTYYKTVYINGRDVEIDTNSRDISAVFDGKVNRQYNNLIEDTFGRRNNLTGDIEIDRGIKKMLSTNSAKEDLLLSPDENASENTKNYLRILNQVHEASGLEPKDNETTEVYLREALQKMKDEGINIRRFVKNILENDDIAPIDKKPIDDVYR